MSDLVVDASLTLQWLTNYDAAYLALAEQLQLPFATTDVELRGAAVAANVAIVTG